MDKKPASLADACQFILNRVNRHRSSSLPCFLCDFYVVGGEAKLMEHLANRHNVFVCDFSDVVDLNGYLLCIKDRMGLGKEPAAAKSLQCPVCLECLASLIGDDISQALSALQLHMRTTGHNQWSPREIHELKEFCLAAYEAPPVGGENSELADPTASVSSRGKSCGSSAGMYHGDPGKNDLDALEDAAFDDDDGNWTQTCTCLFCAVSSEDVLGHMKDVHHFDFRSAVRDRRDVQDEYDIIRLINAVRRCVSDGKCPYKYRSDGHTDCTSCPFDSTLEQHLLGHPSHRLPEVISRTFDSDLIAVFPDDGLISLVVTSGVGFLASEETEPDYPMAPTLQEIAKYNASHSAAK